MAWQWQNALRSRERQNGEREEEEERICTKKKEEEEEEKVCGTKCAMLLVCVFFTI